MANDDLRGKTILWTFTDGPMADKRYEHTFAADGSVSFRLLGGESAGKPTRVDRYEAESVGPAVHAVSYLGPSGHTLTTVLDFNTGKLVAFASNEKELSVHHGTFEVGGVEAGLSVEDYRQSLQKLRQVW